MIDQERLGLPSASSALYDSLCNGRYLLQRQWDESIPEPEDEATEENGGSSPDTTDIDRDADAGKRIHLLYAGKECPEATDAERDRAEKGRRVDQAKRNEWLSKLGYENLGPITEIRERRWWLYDAQGHPVYSGQTDAVWVVGDDTTCDILVADLKGLWGQHDASPINMQLRRYIALIAQNVEELGFKEINSASCYLNQPVKTLDPPITVYSKDDIEMATFEMACDLAAITTDGAKRTAGPVQCHHCRAKLICPEYAEQQLEVMQVAAAAPAELPSPPSKERIELAIDHLPGPDLARLLDWAPALENAVKIAKSEAKRRLGQDINSIPGYRLKDNADRTKIDDLKTLFQRLHRKFKVDGDAFATICGTTKKDLTELVKMKSGIRGQSLDAEIKELLDGITHPIKVSRSVERIT